VSPEPRATQNSLITGKIQGIFCNLQGKGLGRASIVPVVSDGYSEIPYATEQGILEGLTGNFFQRTGNFSRQNREFDLGPIF
jgi:hypothetical protein